MSEDVVSQKTIHSAAVLLSTVLDCIGVDLTTLTTKQNGSAMQAVIKGLENYYTERSKELKN